MSSSQPPVVFKTIKGSEYKTTRLTAVGDSNLAGNVHGGVIMQEIEQSGFIAAARFCGYKSFFFFFFFFFEKENSD